jgi:ABC-type Zn uptake system ZnuABC Zn-binding protein ZnuA
MRVFVLRFWVPLFLISFIFSACSPEPGNSTNNNTVKKIIAVESFLADITQNVAGDRFQVDSLIPINVEPHTFEASPRDVVKISESSILIINGAGFETWIDPVLQNAGGKRTVIIASKGLPSRDKTQSDPHFWMDPTKVITYVENIRDGLIEADPAGKDIYTHNADSYILKLKDLDAWIKDQVSQIPPQNRLLVTNHESIGYFADRYGFQVIGAIIPSVSTDAAPSAQQVAQLIDHIRATGSKAIFLEMGANPDLAKQISSETGVVVVADLYTHSLTEASGPAPTYLEMIKTDVNKIVVALK